MSAYTQQDRRLILTTPLGDDALLLTKVQGEEGISRLFQFTVNMSSEQDSIAARSIVGKNVSFSIRQTNGDPRYFNGLVKSFSYRGQDDRFQLYAMEVVPWLWMLTKTSDCRIFQNKSAVEIIEQVFSDLGMTAFEKTEIKRDHAQRDYCTQYRETDFEFVTRLMEEEGIFYYFRHQEGKHTLVLADQKDACKDAAESEVEFKSNLSQTDAADQITAWEHQYEMRTGRFTQTDYNFETPSAILLSSTKTVVKLDNIEKLEDYDYPGNYAKKPDGDTEIKLRMEAEEAGYETVLASSRCASFSPGLKFKLSGHHAESEESTYAITDIRHTAQQPASYVSGGEAVESDYTNMFRCIPASVVFRPRLAQPRPRVQGIQTAVVVGPAGQEIYTDKYGRIKVQFFWDRQGKKDENSSCWIRVAQAWAGKNWGSIFLPRIGQEVIISFLEGDPDRPIVTGSVYNADQMPPYTLPDEKTKSTIKSNSSIGSGGFNEIRFEDKKGSEQIFIHGQKDQEVRIENDSLKWVGHQMHLYVKDNYYEHFDGERHEEITKSHFEHIGGDRNLTVDKSDVTEIEGNHTHKVTGDVVMEVQGGQSVKVANDLVIKANNIVIEADTNITIKVGGSYVAIEDGGIKVYTSAELELEGGATAELKSPQTSVKGDAMTEITGGMVKIN